MSLLELDKTVAAYGKVEALKGLSLRVEEGEIVALLGANGAGKSTTLRTISGLMKPQSGTVRFLGQSIGGLSPETIVRLGIAHVPERRRIFPGLTVRENIILGGSNRTATCATGLSGNRRHPPTDDGAAGRAKRAHGPLSRRPRLRTGNRPPGDRGETRGAVEQRGGSRRLSRQTSGEAGVKAGQGCDGVCTNAGSRCRHC